jgi:hypothetical protein
MEEDDEIARTRNELKKEKNNLTGFSDRLARLVHQVNVPTSDHPLMNDEYDDEGRTSSDVTMTGPDDDSSGKSAPS